MTGQSTIRSLAAGLPDGQTLRALCPGCGGGRSGERSLAITRDGLALRYKCHRASCTVAGIKGTGSFVEARGRVFEPFPYPYGLRFPGPSHWVWERLRTGGSPGLAARIGLATKDGEDNDLVWELRGLDWQARGHVSRTYPTKTIRTWRLMDGPVYGYFATERTDRLWVVEDPLSAARVQLSGRAALCLCGTNLGPDLQRDLVRWAGEQETVLGRPVELRIALDPDATEVGREMARRLTSRAGLATMWVPMTKDLKDMEPGELGEVLGT